MPCINIAEPPVATCPCWTEDELDFIAEQATTFCRGNLIEALIIGIDATTGSRDVAQTGAGLPGFEFCFYREWTPDTSRFLRISVEEVEICAASVLAECESRGF
jgi:hypothetical protein